MPGPLAKPTIETSATIHDFTPPTRYKHQPIFMTPYAPFDGPYVGKTDAKYLSIGLAQWRSGDDPFAISAKVWRNTGEKWSRMSEEIPLHRLADLCTFAVKTFFQKHSTSAIAPTALLPAGTFEGQQEDLVLHRMNEVPAAFENQTERLKERLRKLRDELNQADLGEQE